MNLLRILVLFAIIYSEPVLTKGHITVRAIDKVRNYTKFGLQIQIKGLKNQDPKQILEVIETNNISSPELIRNLLLQTYLFQTVDVSRHDNVLKISVKEYPVAVETSSGTIQDTLIPAPTPDASRSIR